VRRGCFVGNAVEYLRLVLNPKKEEPLNNLESLFASIEAGQK
jgi:hypothetical protein